MNEFKRHEAYVRVRGLPFDVKIDGWARQSRSVHGDEVCVLIDPSEEWERVGGGDDGDDVCASVDVDADGGRRVESMAAVCRRGWRPTGIVVATVTPSARRANMVGKLEMETNEALTFVPVDEKLPKGRVSEYSVPRSIKSALESGGKEGAVDTFVSVKLRKWRRETFGGHSRRCRSREHRERFRHHDQGDCGRTSHRER